MRALVGCIAVCCACCRVALLARMCVLLLQVHKGPRLGQFEAHGRLRFLAAHVFKAAGQRHSGQGGLPRARPNALCTRRGRALIRCGFWSKPATKRASSGCIMPAGAAGAHVHALAVCAASVLWCAEVWCGAQVCDYRQFTLSSPNPHILYGALVGGPDPSDIYRCVRRCMLAHWAHVQQHSWRARAAAGTTGRTCAPTKSRPTTTPGPRV